MPSLRKPAKTKAAAVGVVRRKNEDGPAPVSARSPNQCCPFQSSRALPKTLGAAKLGETAGPESVTVTGKVVDAACFMLHEPAATSASHKEYAAACLARGVPLAIATDDGALYFPADGNERLQSLLNAHVRASGAVVEKHESMELKMPVGDKNQMVVRVEGGYKQITIATLVRIPAEKS